MSKQISESSQSTQESLQIKLLALYDLNKSYIDAAEKFLSDSSKKSHGEFRNETLMQKDLDRLYSHIFVLEHIAKLLYEGFLIERNGGLPEWQNGDSDRRKKQINE